MPISNVYNIDCIEYMKTLPDKFFDLAIVDPPYGDALGGGYGTSLPCRRPMGQIQEGGGDLASGSTVTSRFYPHPGTTASEDGSTDTSRQRVNHVYGGRFERYNINKLPPPKSIRTGGTWFAKYDHRPFCDGRTDEGNKVKYGSIDWDICPPAEYFEQLFRVSKNQIIWGGNYFELPPTRCFVVWRKLTISENFSMAMAEYAWTSFQANAKVFEYAPQGSSKEPRIHACQKPIALYQFLLKHFAKPGDKIFDSHMGSQSSRVACYGMGFDYWGCEIDPDYFRMGNERFERQCHGKQKTRDGQTIHQLDIFNENERT